jgi:hypothetical protein
MSAVTLREIVRGLRAFDRLAPTLERRPKPVPRNDSDDDHRGSGGGAGYGDSTALAIRTATI